jgi:hypothetical protein
VQSLLTGVVLSCHTVYISWCGPSLPSWEGARPYGTSNPLWCGPPGSLVDWFFMGRPAFFEGSLSDVRMIMAIWHVPMVELICQVVMGLVPVLECLLSGTRGRLGLCLVLFGIKWPRYTRIPASGFTFLVWETPRCGSQGLGCVPSRGSRSLDWANRW